MSSLLRHFLSFCILKVLFPDFLELRVSFGLYKEEDFEIMIRESIHLIRDVMNPIGPQAGFRQATVLYREYGSFRSCDDPFISHWIRNKVLVMTQSLLLFQHFLGVDYRTIRHPHHQMRRAVASTIKYMFDVLLKPVIELQDSRSSELVMQRLNQSSRRKTAKLPKFELMYGSDVVNFRLFSSPIFHPVFDVLRCLVVPFLNGKPNLQMNDSEMAVLIIWNALKILEIHDDENEMFGLREIVCLSDDRTPTEKLSTMSPQTLISFATCNGGILLSRAIKWFSSQKIFCVALERSQICAMQGAPPGAPLQGAPPGEPPGAPPRELFEAPMPYD